MESLSGGIVLFHRNSKWDGGNDSPPHFYQIYRISARRARSFFAPAQLSACCTEPVVRVVSVVVKKKHPVVFSIFNFQFMNNNSPTLPLSIHIEAR